MTPGELIEAQIIARRNVLEQVLRERNRQDAKWGGAANDDQWNALDWHEMIADYNAWARRMACMGSFDKARNRYVQIAALAVAAVEALDRKEQAHTIAPR
jgi:hypothetical protein